MNKSAVLFPLTDACDVPRTMKYHDTGSRAPSEALATWLSDNVAPAIAHLRVQTGFFAIQAIGILRPIFEQAAKSDSVRVSLLIGSNEGDTLASHIDGLVQVLGIPRPNVKLGIVSYGTGDYYHPKVYHVARTDGGTAAFVGSANLTKNGLARHVEAAISLESAEGDSAPILNQIARAVDVWFEEARPGISFITSAEDVARLLAVGILAAAPKPRARASGPASAYSPGRRPRLGSLVTLPDAGFQAPDPEQDEGEAAGGGVAAPAQATQAAAPAAVPPATPAAPAAAAPAAQAATQVAVPPATPVASAAGIQAPAPVAAVAPGPVTVFTPVAGYPGHIPIQQGVATHGLSALSNTPLPNNAVGLILRLNKDSARLFAGGAKGTPNISLPIPYGNTLVLALTPNHKNPRAEFNLYARYRTDVATLGRVNATTSVTLYGYGIGATGKRNLRLSIPKTIGGLAPFIQTAGHALPADEDIVSLEWPTAASPEYRLTLMPRTSQLAVSLEALYHAADTGRLLVGNACLLPAGLLPIW